MSTQIILGPPAASELLMNFLPSSGLTQLPQGSESTKESLVPRLTGAERPLSVSLTCLPVTNETKQWFGALTMETSLGGESVSSLEKYMKSENSTRWVTPQSDVLL